MILHTINKSPQHSAISACLRIIGKGSAILLIEDGVYAAISPSPFHNQLCDLKIYALEADIKARGLSDKVLPGIETVDYQGFVALTAQYDSVQSWF